MSVTIPSEGTKLQYKVATVYTDIGRVEEVEGPDSSVAAIKKTALESTVHQYRPSKIPEPGKLTFKLQLDPNDTVHAGLFSRIATPGTVDDWKVVFVDGMAVPANVTFSGFVTKFKPTGVKVEENLMAELEVQCTTMPILTAGAAS